MRHSLILLFALAVLLGDSLQAGNTKIPSSSSTPNGFDLKKARHYAPSAAQHSLFASDVANLTDRIAAATQVQADALQKLTPAQRVALESLRSSNPGRLAISWDDVHAVPIFVQGLAGAAMETDGSSLPSREQAQRVASEFLQANAGLLRIQDPASEFKQIDLQQDALGFTHIRYQQMYRGSEVWGRDVRVHVNSQGKVESFNGRYIPTPAGLVSDITTADAASAQAIAVERCGRDCRVTGVRNVYLPDDAGRLTLCWVVSVAGGLDLRNDVFVDAGTGQVAKVYNRVAMDGPVTGSGIDLQGVTRSLGVYQIGTQYLMIDASKTMYNASQSQMPADGKGVIYAFDARNAEQSIYYITSTTASSWSSRPGVSALYTGGKIYDYYRTVHNRNAIDNQGGTMNFIVNFKSNYSNAFWNGQYMVFGNGDGTTFSDLAGAADVAAHELTHGVTENTANLLYENQSGALNESFSDVFGTLFEFWLKSSGGNWLLGEDVFTPGTPGDALRSMSDPAGPEVPPGSRQPTKMSEYKNLPNDKSGDYGGVHINSGIPNKAFYLFATASGMTKEEAGQVYYRVLTTYLTKNSQFVDCRLSVIKAAEDLFGGAGNAKALAAAAAFDAVGITSGTATTPPTSDPPVQGTQYVALVNVSDGYLYRWTMGTTTFAKLSTMALASRPAVMDNGTYLFYVDQTNNLHVVGSDGTNDQTLSSGGGFNNIAVSRSGRYLAATTTFSEAKIYVFDLQNSAGNKVLQLYTPVYHTGESSGSIWYPDRIDWTADETRIMYDAYNTTVLTGGDTLGFWDINTVRLAEGTCSRLFAAQPRGINIGNAVYASNTDNLIAFDYMDENSQVKVLAVNLNTGDAGVVTNNYSSLGNPSFSVDDKKIYYHYINQSSSQYQVWAVDLLTDGITGSGSDVKQLDGGVYPLAFAVGTRPTDVPVSAELPQGCLLEQNYPNPFNPGTRISFQIPVAGKVTLKVYDILGREVATLVDAQVPAGVHAVPFDGSGLSSGVYLYRLDAGGVTQSRRMIMAK
ncbi:MAG: peptidase family protein [Bacteroidetes bacterium]|nr:peptidase family protein [Bacteroidota bacterium]